MTETVFMYRASFYCWGHGMEIRSRLHQAVEDCEIRCPNFDDCEQWPVSIDPSVVGRDDYCDDCVSVALKNHWPVSIALLKEF